MIARIVLEIVTIIVIFFICFWLWYRLPRFIKPIVARVTRKGPPPAPAKNKQKNWRAQEESQTEQNAPSDTQNKS